MKPNYAPASRASILFFLTLSFTVFSCSPQASSPHYWVYEEAPDFETVLEHAQTAKAICPAGSGCHSGLGHVVLIAQKQNKMGFEGGSCTGFLIRPDLMVTSGHCVPEEIVKNEVSCSDGRLRITFPRMSGFPEESALCQSVLYATPKRTRKKEDVFKSDIALVKLNRAFEDRMTFPVQHLQPKSVAVIPFKRNSRPDEIPVRIFKMTPLREKGRWVSIYEEEKCGYSLLLNPFDSVASKGEFVNRATSSMILKGCHPVEGNSGGPVVEDVYSQTALGAIDSEHLWEESGHSTNRIYEFSHATGIQYLFEVNQQNKEVMDALYGL